MPISAIIASLPLASSEANLRSLPASSSGSKPVKKPKSPVAPLDPGFWSWLSSANPAYAKIWIQPAAGIFTTAPSPFGMSAYFKPRLGDK
eukprot:28743-Amphidinium_carterae.1